jgi:hypothetical protein
MGTHINAYQQEVEDKKAAVGLAQGALAVAEAALKAHPDYVAPKKSETPAKAATKARTKSGQFTKKS